MGYFSVLKVMITQGPPNVIFALKGELDLTTSRILRKEVEKIELDKVASITFSLNELKFIDSTGIGQLIGYYRSFAKQHTSVYIDNKNADIEEVLELIGVREIMET